MSTPNNTIFFDDFERTSIGYWGNVSDGAGFVSGSIGAKTGNFTIIGNNSLSINETNNANFGDEWAVRNINTNATTIGISCDMAFNLNMYNTADGQAILCGALYYDSSGDQLEVRVEYRAHLAQWVLFDSSNGQPAGSATPVIIQQLAHGYLAFDDSNSRFYRYTAIHSKIVFNRVTNQYVSFCGGSFCQDLQSKHYVIGSLATGLVTFPPQADLTLFCDVALDTTTVTNGAKALFDNFLVTDEGNSPNLIQFTFFNASLTVAMFLGAIIPGIIYATFIRPRTQKPRLTPEQQTKMMRIGMVVIVAMAMLSFTLWVFGKALFNG